jgi:tRNA G10  N-methylase Trm11
MNNFWYSNLFQTITIFVVGAFVYIMYLVNKKDERSIAATILIMEIREIEGALKKLLEVSLGGNFYSSIPIIKENSWEKYKFIFIKYLDQDEYNLISEFYSTACRIEKERLILIKQIIFGFETKCEAMHKSFIDIAKQKYEISKDEFLAITEKIAEKARMNTPGFQSDVPKILINSLLQNIKYITTSTAGLKIKKIARIT